MNFEEVPHGLDFVNQMKPVSFVFKKSRENATPHGPQKYGFKAQDILALEGDNNVIISNDDEENLKVTNSYLTPVLVNAIQELTKRIEELEKSKISKEVCQLLVVQISYKYKKDLIYRNLTNGNNTKYHY